MRAVIRELIETVILAVLIFVGLQFSVQPYKVEGSSMDPTMEQGEYLLVNKLVYLNFHPQGVLKWAPFLSRSEEAAAYPFHPPKRGEIIIFRFPLDPSRSFVKRVIGVPGDTVEIRKGQVFVNSRPIDEPYVTHTASGSMDATTVPEDSYFVMGDNRRASDDSRNWGPVPASHVVGRGWISYWPPGQLQDILPFGN